MSGNVFATIDHDISRVTMFTILHREVEGLFREATKLGCYVVTWIPQKEFCGSGGEWRI